MLVFLISRFNYENVTAYCTAIGQQIIDVLEGLDGITYNSNERYVANFGNSDALVTGDWVPIIRTAPRAAQVRFHSGIFTIPNNNVFLQIWVRCNEN